MLLFILQTASEKIRKNKGRKRQNDRMVTVKMCSIFWSELYISKGVEKMRDQLRTKMGIRISILERVMKIYFNHGLEDLQIGWGQQYAMVCIAERPGITALELAEYIHVDKATITKLMKKLTQLEYIHVETDPNDRRIRHLYLTDEAQGVIRRIKLLQQEFEEDLLAGINENDRELLGTWMEQMIDNMTHRVRYKLEEI